MRNHTYATHDLMLVHNSYNMQINFGSNITFKTNFDFAHSLFKVVQASITLQNSTTFLYHPPPNRQNNLTDFTEHLHFCFFTLRVQFVALCFSPCTLSLCLPLLTHYHTPFLRKAHSTEHPSRGCPNLVLISQLSRQKQCG